MGGAERTVRELSLDTCASPQEAARLDGMVGVDGGFGAMRSSAVRVTPGKSIVCVGSQPY